MKNIFKLLAVSYQFKKISRKCLKQANDSVEYKLAKLYKDEIEKLEDSDVNSANINALINQVKGDKTKYAASENVQELLSDTLSFLEVLKTFAKS